MKCVFGVLLAYLWLSCTCPVLSCPVLSCLTFDVVLSLYLSIYLSIYLASLRFASLRTTSTTTVHRYSSYPTTQYDSFGDNSFGDTQLWLSLLSEQKDAFLTRCNGWGGRSKVLWIGYKKTIQIMFFIHSIV